MKVFNNLDVAGDIRDMMFSKGDSEGKGFGVYTDPDGNRVVEADILVGRLGARFKELKVYQTEYMGGDFILSPACLTVSEVVQEDSYCRCFFDTKDGSVLNDFVVGDGAFCQRYSPHDYKYYWMRVIAVGTDYIDLSKDDRDSGGYLPAEGDVVIQLGNATDKSRQGAIFISTEGDDAPSFTICGEIDGFTLEDKNLGGWKYDTDREEMVLYGFGSFVFGSKDGTSGISYDKKTGKVVVSGDMNIGSGSSGLENFSEWSGKQALITKAQTAADKAQSTANTASSAAENAQQSADSAQQAADNAQQSADSAQQTATDARAKADEVERSLTSTAETLNQAISKAEKAAKDYTDAGKDALQDSIDTLEQTKASVESVDAITKSDGLISAAEQRAIAAAEAAADAAQREAETNANAYADGEIKKAEQEAINTANANLEAAKAELNESIARLDEETSDAMDAAEAAATKAEAAQSEAATATETSNAAKDIADAAKGLAEAADSNASQAAATAEEANTKALAAEGIAQQAQELADTAKGLANTANKNAADAAADASAAKEEASVASGKLSNWASDSVISPFEKQGVKDEYAFVVADKEDIDKQVTKYEVEDNTFETAYNTYKSDLETIVNATTESVAIPTNMSTHQSEYYSARTTILESISTAAKEVADDAQSAADTAQKTADNAQIAADNAQKDAEAAQRTANEAKVAADAAKRVTDNLNNDLVFSLTEKRSIRSKLKDINPSETQAIRVNTFMLGAVESKDSGSWSKVTDEADANYGWYVSDMHTDGSYAIAKVNFTVVEAGSSMTVHIMSRAELSYDYTMLGDIDTELSEPTYETEGIVAETSDNQEEDISHTFTDLTVGEHFFCVYYYKDGSDYGSLDNGYFKIDDALFLKGSLGDYLALCKEKGIDYGDAEAKADALFEYLYEKEVWKNTDTVLNKSDDFRNRVYGLFQDYYAAITGIQQEITKSDYEYLTEAFGKSKNLNVEGVVMSQLMAVRNEDGEVEAFMNGSKYAGNTGAKLIIAAGIPETASDGSKNLEDRAKEANTQLWENGRFKTTDAEIEGEIKASTGKIGPLHISENGLSMLDWPDDLQVGETCPLIALHVDALSFSVMKLTSSTSGTSVNNVSIPLSNTLSFGLRVTRDNNHMNRNYAAIEAVCNGGNGIGNLAFRALSGMFSGLRPKTRVITTAKTSADPNVLDEFDYSVFVNLPSGTCYIDLPKNPQDGQEYYIESRGAKMSIKMYQQGYSLYSGNTAAAGYSVTQTSRALLRFKYYAEASLWVYSWLNRNS